MYSRGLMLALKHLASIGQHKLGHKIIRTVTTGKVLNLTSKERDIFNVVRGTLLGKNKTVSLAPPKIIAPGVKIRSELIFNPKGGVKGKGSLGRFYVSDTKNVPTIDIDFPDILKSHGVQQTIFKTKKEALENFRYFMGTPFGKKSAFKMYDTPAGMRLFDITKRSRKTPTLEYGGVMDELGADPFFINWSQARRAYSSRLSPKPGRLGDFIARPLSGMPINRVIAGPDAVLSRRSYNEVRNTHDFLVDKILRRAREKDRVSLGGLFDLLA